ncbi:hypothetical protein C8721_003887 [Salmonella enterica subsp. enterica serovar Berta]|nr:hypothetical protein [Salmonella enterica subsp. enterica serovar Berta]EDR6293342.1 hypothetical protein [Salmonella enterica subsp. enterica serovar Pensacola]EDS3455581.1 hypothetical protein [Salmonella enterica]EDU4886074.1 hypothetical protein [Salmonella enterica subsp. enterica serovar Java]EDR4318548.1 hypothetical protein [Salmonella enterica subsp. enterica serovar Berta]
MGTYVTNTGLMATYGSRFTLTYSPDCRIQFTARVDCDDNRSCACSSV